MTHWRAPKQSMVKHYAADRRSWQTQRRWNLSPLAGLLLHALLWASICWIIAASL